MKLSDFMYDLPEERIAQTPVEPRDHSRLMVLNREKHTIEHRHFYDVIDYLNSGDALVINETRVIPARLIGERPSGGACEILLLKQLAPKRWEALVRPGKKLRPGAEVSFGGGRLTARMLKIAVPLAVSAYARSALTTFQHLLVPRGLKSSGYSADGALSGYGTIQGMVLPILLFPSCIMAAVAELIVPELTEAQVQEDSGNIRRTNLGLFRLSVTFSTVVGAFMFIFADMLGMAVYKSADAGHYIRILAPLIPVMYTDMTVDGCLKGLGQQVWSMGINILDALLGLVLVWWMLPKYALTAYIGIIYLTEIVNFAMSLARLKKVTGLRFLPAILS